MRSANARLAAEVGTIHKQGDPPFALVYPSPYRVGMSSLGFQTIYRDAERACPASPPSAPSCPTTSATRAMPASRCAPTSRARPVGDFPIVAFSLAYELELAGVVDCLELAGIPALAEERAGAPALPLIVVGGPLTFSNPVPAAPFADVIAARRGRRDAAPS